MNLEAKMQDPISIKIGENSNVILADQKCEMEYPLVPGVVCGGEHFGFILISDNNGKQREFFYPTQCRIDAIGIEGGILKVFEEGKRLSWGFDQSGKLEHSAFGDFTDEYRKKIDTIVENYEMFTGEPKLENPLRVRISIDSEKEQSMILQDELTKKDYPLCPGVILGTIHYGFILMFDTEHGKKEVVYPTQNRIDAIGIEKNCYNDLKVFENGKYHPWVFTFDGKFKKQASYNQYSKRDKKFIEEVYGLNEFQNEDIFTLRKKKQK